MKELKEKIIDKMVENMEYPINASNINDFMFCPYSIMIHNMYEDMPKMLYQSEKQVWGTFSHAIDEEEFSFSTEESIE